MARRVKYFFKPGQQFNHWTIVDGKRYGAPAKVDVKCVCGEIRRVDVYSLIHGRSTNCGCKAVGKDSPLWTGAENLSGTAIFRNLQSAGASHNKVLLGAQEAAEVYTTQSASCAITGQSLDSSTARLVRYSNSLPYQVGNVAWVHTDVYRAVNSVGVSGTTTMATSLSSNPTSINIFQKLGFSPVDSGEEIK